LLKDGVLLIVQMSVRRLFTPSCGTSSTECMLAKLSDVHEMSKMIREINITSALVHDFYCCF